jgi:hypothetical protein
MDKGMRLEVDRYRYTVSFENVGSGYFITGRAKFKA